MPAIPDTHYYILSSNESVHHPIALRLSLLFAPNYKGYIWSTSFVDLQSFLAFNHELHNIIFAKLSRA